MIEYRLVVLAGKEPRELTGANGTTFNIEPFEWTYMKRTDPNEVLDRYRNLLRDLPEVQPHLRIDCRTVTPWVPLDAAVMDPASMSPVIEAP